MSIRVSLRGMHRLMRVDTLRKVHTVGFLVERLNFFIYSYNSNFDSVVVRASASMSVKLSVWQSGSLAA